MPHLSGFHKLTPPQRRAALGAHHEAELLDALTRLDADTVEALDRMSENVIGAFSLPLSVVTGLAIDGVERDIAMVTEEPSVVAAANAAAACFTRAGGVAVHVAPPVTSAQVVYVAPSPTLAQRIGDDFTAQADRWLALANACDPKLVAAGGGAFALHFSCQPAEPAALSSTTFLAFTLDVHTADAMGANAVNTMAESLMHAMHDEMAAQFGQDAPEPLMAILTNASPQRLVEASIELDLDAIANYKRGFAGEELARRIELGANFAQCCPSRAVTHNKGILNGTCAVANALGQDTRAMCAAAIDHACSTGVHRPLSTWQKTRKGLQGKLVMPIVVGLVGGTRHAHKPIEAAFELARIRTYHDLCAVIASVGLAQNFAALAALVTEGIQAGHMKLHARKNAFP